MRWVFRNGLSNSLSQLKKIQLWHIEAPPELRPTAVALPSRLMIPEELVASPCGFAPGPPEPSVSIFLLNLWATARDLQSDWSL